MLSSRMGPYSPRVEYVPSRYRPVSADDEDDDPDEDEEDEDDDPDEDDEDDDPAEDDSAEPPA